MLVLRNFGLLAIAFLASSFLRPRHDFHTSLAEIRYNKATDALEIEIRLFTDDFTEAIKREYNKPKVDLSDSTLEPEIALYLKKKFAFIKEKHVVFAEYLGKEFEGDITWVYLELKNPARLEGFSLMNILLCELFDDQNNVVNYIYPQGRITQLFKKEENLHIYPF